MVNHVLLLVFRQRHFVVQPGLLDPETPPEDHRGGTGDRGRARGLPRDGEGRRAAGQGRGLRQRRHRRVPIHRRRQATTAC